MTVNPYVPPYTHLDIPFVEKIAPFRTLINKRLKAGVSLVKIAEELRDLGVTTGTTATPWQAATESAEYRARRQRNNIYGLLRHHYYKYGPMPVTYESEKERLRILDLQIKATMAKAATFGRPRGRVIDMGGVRDRWLTWTARDQAREIRTFASYSYAPYQVEKEPEQ